MSFLCHLLQIQGRNEQVLVADSRGLGAILRNIRQVYRNSHHQQSSQANRQTLRPRLLYIEGEFLFIDFSNICSF